MCSCLPDKRESPAFRAYSTSTGTWRSTVSYDSAVNPQRFEFELTMHGFQYDNDECALWVFLRERESGYFPADVVGEIVAWSFRSRETRTLERINRLPTEEGRDIYVHVCMYKSEQEENYQISAVFYATAPFSELSARIYARETGSIITSVNRSVTNEAKTNLIKFSFRSQNRERYITISRE